MKLYQVIAQTFAAYQNCEKSGNAEWMERHAEKIESIVKERFPRGSGFDSGTSFDWQAATPEKLVFVTYFYHISEQGGYDGWSEHRITVRPSLVFGFTLTVSGKNRNRIKDYISEVFADILETASDRTLDR